MNDWIKAASLGMITGVRSTAGLRAVGRHYLLDRYQPWLGRLAWAESAFDKLPWIPSRTQAVSLVGRGVLGAAAGANVRPGADRAQRALLIAVGAASAIAATYAFCGVRRAVGKRGRIAGTVAGFAEDALVEAVRRRVA
jgi:uncharacterized membrane protein